MGQLWLKRIEYRKKGSGELRKVESPLYSNFRVHDCCIYCIPGFQFPSGTAPPLPDPVIFAKKLFYVLRADAATLFLLNLSLHPAPAKHMAKNIEKNH